MRLLGERKLQQMLLMRPALTEKKEFPGPPKIDHVPFDNINCPFKDLKVLGAMGEGRVSATCS